ncbi:hypothetical protein BU16DRAFT_615473 [Lophium mytilinum]|uniref:C3H1-type domain-containing protein n=1 Tax=Lophium mytilinum TaxID=390894 RepID=A0A6A6R1M5_9PEZI|nr:hypothetical protein BU16DRAFT_615473 [Lophium mytilinum]
MAGFSFPPPPPPPPRSTAPEPSAPSSSSQRGGYNSNYRGDRGGRGSLGGRGRGRGQSNTHTRRQPQRGSHGFQQSRSPQAGGERQQEHAGRSRGQNQHYGHSYVPQQQQAQTQSPQTSSTAYGQAQVPANAYVNPSLAMMAPQMQNTAHVQPQIDPMAFMQAFSTFMVSQAGVQNVPAQVNHTVPGQYPTSPPRNFRNQQSPPAMAGSKRKRVSNEGHQERHLPKTQNNASTRSKPAKAKAKVPPTVPSFGITLPTAPKASLAPPPTLPKGKRDGKKAKKGNLLGLTPQVDHSDSDLESVDEETIFGANITGLIFEYNGETAALNSPAEIAAWIRERRRLYPTKARAKQKLEEDHVRLANEQAILRRVKEEAGPKAGAAVKSEKKDKKADKKPKSTSEVERKQVEHGRQLKKIEKLRKKLQKSEEMLAKSEGTSTLGQIGTIEVKTPSAPSGVGLSKNGLGLDYGSDTESASRSTDSDGSSDSDSESDSVSESESDDEDSAPEEKTSKAHLPMRVPPPKDPMKQKTEQTICPYHKRSGKCTNKRCKFLHPAEMAAKDPKKRVTLYDRMVEQEEKAADMLAFQAIKYLGSTGFLS